MQDPHHFSNYHHHREMITSKHRVKHSAARWMNKSEKVRQQQLA